MLWRDGTYHHQSSPSMLMRMQLDFWLALDGGFSACAYQNKIQAMISVVLIFASLQVALAQLFNVCWAASASMRGSVGC
jgi:hypothetical protein